MSCRSELAAVPAARAAPPGVRRATTGDAATILELVNALASRQLMLPRSPASIIENIRDFFVVEEAGVFAGCGSLHVVWSELAEVRSLAVDPAVHRRGLGRVLVERLLQDAAELGIATVFAFTYVPGFFERMGFHRVEHASLPHKVFSDCLHCPKFNACDEVAMLRELRPPTAAPAQGPLSLPRRGLPLPRLGS